MEGMVYIYGLKDPETDEIRYVGKTNNLKNRYHGHICLCSTDTNRHKASWIKSLRKRNLKPEMIVLEEVDDCCWQEKEKFWIDKYKNIGRGLTNINGVVSPYEYYSNPQREDIDGVVKTFLTEPDYMEYLRLPEHTRLEIMINIGQYSANKYFRLYMDNYRGKPVDGEMLRFASIDVSNYSKVLVSRYETL